MNLQLSLKKNWFEMTSSGEKTEDYREITPYWCNRLFNKKRDYMGLSFWTGFLGVTENNKRVYKFRGQYEINKAIKEIGFKPFTYNTMTLGYPKKTDTSRILRLEHKGIEIRTGNPEWGAEPNRLYFVIKHGEEILK